VTRTSGKMQCDDKDESIANVQAYAEDNIASGSAISFNTALCGFANLSEEYYAQHFNLRVSLLQNLRNILEEKPVAADTHAAAIQKLCTKMLSVYYVHDDFQEQEEDESLFEWLQGIDQSDTASDHSSSINS
jgi:hypothetical protein